MSRNSRNWRSRHVALSCTPFTTTLPIRRLPLHVGDTAEIAVALVDVETLEVRPVRRRYTRVGERRWVITDLDRDVTPAEPISVDVDEHGLVLDEPGRFRRIL